MSCCLLLLKWAYSTSSASSAGRAQAAFWGSNEGCMARVKLIKCTRNVQGPAAAAHAHFLTGRTAWSRIATVSVGAGSEADQTTAVVSLRLNPNSST